jgi:hypothetical protein
VCHPHDFIPFPVHYTNTTYCRQLQHKIQSLENTIKESQREIFVLNEENEKLRLGVGQRGDDFKGLSPVRKSTALSMNSAATQPTSSSLARSIPIALAAASGTDARSRNLETKSKPISSNRASSLDASTSVFTPSSNHRYPITSLSLDSSLNVGGGFRATPITYQNKPQDKWTPSTPNVTDVAPPPSPPPPPPPPPATKKSKPTKSSQSKSFSSSLGGDSSSMSDLNDIMAALEK